MKYRDVHILFDKNGDVTEKLGKDLATVLILPNAQILEYNSDYESDDEND